MSPDQIAMCKAISTMPGDATLRKVWLEGARAGMTATVIAATPGADHWRIESIVGILWGKLQRAIEAIEQPDRNGMQ